MEFIIDLVLGTNHISKTPYRMTSIELKELKKISLKNYSRVLFSQVFLCGVSNLVCEEEGWQFIVMH